MKGKKSSKKTSKKSNNTKKIDRLKAIVVVFASFFILDGVLRISATFHIFSNLVEVLAPAQFGTFHQRWIIVGIAEIILAFGMLDLKKWALWGLLLLSVIRIYTIAAYPPLGFIYPLQHNMITYIDKLFGIIFAVYFFSKRKHFN